MQEMQEMHKMHKMRKMHKMCGMLCHHYNFVVTSEAFVRFSKFKLLWIQKALEIAIKQKHRKAPSHPGDGK